MYVSHSGSVGGRPLVLLHGGGVAGWMWDPVREHLDDEQRLLVPDLPGHGRSADTDYLSHDDAVTRLIDVLEREDAPGAVVGFSLGAQLAVLLASRRPDLVDRVAIVSAQALPLRAPGLTMALLSTTAGLAQREWFAKAQARALFIPERLVPAYIRTSQGISRDTLLHAVHENVTFTIPEGWSRFRGNATVLVGSKERALMVKSAVALHDALPHSTIEIVDGCGHGLPLQQPAWFAKWLTQWLDA